jgi:hypothetical protein
MKIKKVFVLVVRFCKIVRGSSYMYEFSPHFPDTGDASCIGYVKIGVIQYE